MMKITRSEIENEIESNHSSEQFEQVRWERDEFLDMLFASFTVNADDDIFETWVAYDDPLILVKNVEFGRAEIKNCTNAYVENNRLWCNKLDTLISQLLISAEIAAYTASVMPHLSGFLSSIMMLTMKYGYIYAIIWRFVKSLLLLIIVVGLIVFAFSTDEKLYYVLASLVIAFLGYRIYLRSRVRKKFLELTQAMHKALAQTLTYKINWSTLWEELNDSRKKDVVWDPELYNLVQLRLSA